MVNHSFTPMKFRLIVITWIISSVYVCAQTQQLEINENASPEVSITGTSTLHDWEVVAKDITELPAQISINPDGPDLLQEFSFKVAVETMDGGRGASMNNKIKDAFKAEDNPFVTFRQTEPAKILNKKDGNLNLQSSGILSMAGQEQAVEVKLIASMKDGQMVFSGSHPLKMSDFGMEPPTAMFGQIKTRDDVVVHFKFQYNIK